MRTKIWSLSLPVLLSLMANSATAGIFDDFNPIKAIVAVTTAPAKTILAGTKAVITGTSMSKALDPAKDAAASVSAVPKIVTSVAAWPQEQIYKAAKSAASIAGKPGDFVFDVATFADKYQRDLMKTSGQIATNTLLGQSPLQFLSMPLAAAIHEARDAHIGSAKPLPADVKAGLSSFFTADVLNRARYTVGRVEITLPNGIAKTQKLFGRDYAVTVDDVIVFNTDPGSFSDNPGHWAHETLHTQQYQQWGVEQFALNYVTNSSSVEDAAERRENDVLMWAKNNGIPTATPKSFIASNMVDPQSGPSQTEPLLPAAYVEMRQNQATVVSDDPLIVQFIFPNDPYPYQYFGSKGGRIIAYDPINGQWMHIGWAVPSDIPGPAFQYLIPGRVIYDSFENGDLFWRRPPPVMGPYGWVQPPPTKIGYYVKLPMSTSG